MVEGQAALWGAAAGLRALRGSGWSVLVAEEVGSTMDLVPSLKSLPGLALACHQVSGRGQDSRKWYPVDCGLYLTLVYGIFEEPSRLLGFSLAIGVCIIEQLNKLGAGSLRLKWPNDILALDGRKVGGVIVELGGAELERQGSRCLAVGVGLNIRHSQAALGACQLATLSELMPDRTTDAVYFIPNLAAQLALAIEQALDLFIKEGFAPFRERWLAFAGPMSGQVLVMQNGFEISGKYLGVSAVGALIIEDCAGKIIELFSAHVLAWPGA